MTAILSIAMLAVSVPGAPVSAKVPGPNGQIVFSRVVSADDTVTYVVNPDGSQMRQLFAGFSGFPRWSPDGSDVALLSCLDPPVCDTAAVIVDVATGTYRGLTMPDPTLFTACWVWSSDGRRLACESQSDADPTRNGIYSIRASDGHGLTRITSNPYGDDIPGDFSPNGSHLVFSRTDPSRPQGANVALFVARVNTGVAQRITPWGLPWAEDGGRWSPDGHSILFDDRHSLFVVHPDGTGLRKIALPGGVVQLQNPDWSPDGTAIALSLFMASGQTGIYTMHADGADLQPVTASPTYDRYASWGPYPLGT